MKKIIFLLISTLVFSLYLIHSYNGHTGRSFIYEPVYISLSGDLPENTGLKLIYQTVNDPTLNHEAHLLAQDSIPINTYIFKIDSSYRVNSFSFYFQSLPEEEEFTIREIKAAYNSTRESSFFLRTKDLSVSTNLRVNQLSDNTINLRKIVTETPIIAALHFNIRSSFDEVFVRTDIRIPEIPSLSSLLLIAFLGFLMACLLYPLITNQKLKGISLGAYLLAITIFILPTGEKICNLLLAIAILAGIITGIREGSFRAWIVENRRLLFIVLAIILIYGIALYFSRNDSSKGSVFAIKFGLPMTLVAVAINTNNKHEIRIQYAALLFGVIFSIFIHFGWIVMLADIAEIKTRLISNPIHYLGTSVFTRVHHSYLSLIYLVGLMIVIFNKDVLPLSKKDSIILAILIVTALLFAYSRAAFFSIALILIFHAFRSIFQLLKLEITHVVRFITAFTMTIALLVFIFIDFGAKSSNDNYSIPGIHVRIQIWEDASEIIKQKPLTGWGPNNYSLALQQGNSQDSFNNNTWKNLNTHNQFLETSGMFGLAVGLALIWFLCFPSGFSRQSTKYSGFVFSTTIIFISGFLFESVLKRNLGILIFGIAYGLIIKINTDPSDSLH